MALYARQAGAALAGIARLGAMAQSDFDVCLKDKVVADKVLEQEGIRCPSGQQVVIRKSRTGGQCGCCGAVWPHAGAAAWPHGGGAVWPHGGGAAWPHGGGAAWPHAGRGAVAPPPLHRAA